MSNNYEAPSTDEQSTGSDPYNFGKILGEAPDHEGLIKDNSEVFRQKIELTTEHIRHYMDNRAQHNYDRLHELGKPFLANVYRNMIVENPLLKNVALIDDNIQGNAHFNSIGIENDRFVVPQVHFNISHTETYLKPENLKEGETFGLENVLKEIALRTGARPSEIMRNENLVASFIMLHEFGHALDFRKNYLSPAIAQEKSPSEHAKTLSKAFESNREDRLKDFMTQPLPGHIKLTGNSRLRDFAAAFSKRLRALGVNPNDKDSVVSSIKRSYRDMPSESYADSFATDYIMKHYSDFFEDSNAANPSPEKVKTHVGEWMRIDKDLDLLRLNEGRAVKMTRIDYRRTAEGQLIPIQSKNPHTLTGFLARNIQIGEGICLQKNSDPDTKERYPKSPEVNSVHIYPSKDKDGKIKNDIMIAMGPTNDPLFYRLETTGEQPAEIDVNPKEFLDRYHLDYGSKIMLMKRELNDYSNIKLGNFLGGRLTEHYKDGSLPIALNRSIYLSGTAGEKTGIGDLTDPSFMIGGNTSTVERVYRKWKSYYVKTDTSTYEIIPYM